MPEESLLAVHGVHNYENLLFKFTRINIFIRMCLLKIIFLEKKLLIIRLYIHCITYFKYDYDYNDKKVGK